MFHVTGRHPLQGWFAIRGLGITTINLPNNFEFSIYIHYVDMTGDTKCRTWGGLGPLKVTGSSIIR